MKKRQITQKAVTQQEILQPEQLRLLTIPEVMKILGLGRTKVYDLINSHGLPAVKVDGATRVPLAKLQEWIEQLSSKSIA
ncbi:helix-turn-helix domain-containing protein [Dictyobacter aurantiacus]|uniref:Helix-turn-helix domain-containing protein n=1 Tax=Dictyobacter aurantiacus TaxID=1936993 RepID=A0A401ZGY8_9CHLR|nr:helix-turn-helix domain-containing protein [Dictyobacter aurantiacus]GCE06154.1 hypothetical protein KDAU_34830 [Dictyobacter aurantiacus]